MAIRTKTRSTRLLVIALVSISLATITVDYRQGETGALSGLGRGAITAMAPLQQAISDATRPVGEFVSSVFELPSLRRERDQLRSELEASRASLVQYQSLKQDYDELLAQTELASSIDPNYVTGLVIANSPSNFESVITINKGSADGVSMNMAAIASAGLVGHVVAVSSHAADIQLITDRMSGVAAKLVNAEETGLLEGQDEEDMRMELDPTAVSQIPSQETVVTTSYTIEGSKGLYPPDIAIGTVSRVFADPTGLATSVTVRPAVDFSTLKFVSVVRRDGGG
jgi:rod shape-determining protein MreC